MTAVVLPALTVTQRRVLEVIREYATEHGYPPTLRDISARTGLAVSSVQHQLGRLHTAGWISRVPRSPRTLSVRNPATGGV